jgi:uncharacterized lipoprotein YmbA
MRWRAGLSSGAAAWLLAALVAGGCGSSPPVTFLELEPIAPGTGSVRPEGPPLEVGRVTLPPELDRDELVRRAGDHRLRIDATSRWPAPLDELVRRTLASDLESRLAPRRAVLPGVPAPEGGLQILVVAFDTFSAGTDGAVALSGRWMIVDGTTRATLLDRDLHIEVPAGSGSGPEIAGALSVALARLADEVGAALARRARSEPITPGR